MTYLCKYNNYLCTCWCTSSTITILIIHSITQSNILQLYVLMHQSQHNHYTCHVIWAYIKTAFIRMQ